MLYSIIFAILATFTAPLLAETQAQSFTLEKKKVLEKRQDLNKLLDEQITKQAAEKKKNQLSAQRRRRAKEQLIPAKPGLFGELIPWTLDSNLHPKVKDKLFWIWAVTIFFGDFAGPLWIPQLMTGIEADDGYTGEAVWFWVDHFVYGMFSRSCLNCCCGIGSIFYLFHAFINYPISMINFYSRSLLLKEKKKHREQEKYARENPVIRVKKCPECPKQKIQKCSEEKATIDLKKACEKFNQQMILPQDLLPNSSKEHERFAY